MDDENGKGFDDNSDSIEPDEQTKETDRDEGGAAPQADDSNAAGYSEDEAREAVEQVREICSEILQYLPLQKSPVLHTRQDDQTIFVNIEGDGTGILIGRRGQTLEALQYIVNRIAGRKVRVRKRIEVDTEHYRARRRGQIVAQARRAAEQLRETGEPVYMEPMSASERRVVHLTLKDHPDLYTESEGTLSERRVIVRPRVKND